MENPEPAPAFAWRNTALWVFLLAGFTLLLHLLFSGRYGFFRDELYYIACGHHLAWGYVDQPPLVAVVARLSEVLLGRSLFAIRFFPALAGAAIVFLTGGFAGELGGGKWAQGLAALAILAAPAYLAFDSFLSMNAFEPIFWTLCSLIALRIVRGGDHRLWILFGLVAGIGLLNKNSVLIFGYAIFVALLVTPSARRVFRSPWIWLGAALALGIFVPNLLWQWRHGWPQIHVVLNGRLYKDVPVSWPGFLFQQVLFLGPVMLPVWLAGLWFYFGAREGKPARRWWNRLCRAAPGSESARFLGATYAVLLLVFLLLRMKTYYLLPAYPPLVAGGAVAWERWLRAARWRWARLALPAAVALAGLATLPYGVPVLPIATFLRYQSVVGVGHDVKMERDATGVLPQLYADMFGWRHITAAVAQVYDTLPPEERPGCALLAWNYGEAGAIDYYGGRYGLPQAISGHNQYYLWGPRNYSGQCVIAIGVPQSLLEQMFGSIELKTKVDNPYSMPVEDHLPIYLCRQPRAPLADLWPKLRFYI